MSRKRKAPKRKHYPDPKYKSLTVSKFINAIMYDGKGHRLKKFYILQWIELKVKT